MYSQGEIVAIKLPGGLEHWGVYTEFGTVISASKRIGFVVEESVDDFSGGREVYSKGYPSIIQPYEVVSRARTSIGKSWHLFTDNCQHFANWCHGEKKSPQIRSVVATLGIVFLGALFFISSRR